MAGEVEFAFSPYFMIEQVIRQHKAWCQVLLDTGRAGWWTRAEIAALCEADAKAKGHSASEFTSDAVQGNWRIRRVIEHGGDIAARIRGAPELPIPLPAHISAEVADAIHGATGLPPVLARIAARYVEVECAAREHRELLGPNEFEQFPPSSRPDVRYDLRESDAAVVTPENLFCFTLRPITTPVRIDIATDSPRMIGRLGFFGASGPARGFSLPDVKAFHITVRRVDGTKCEVACGIASALVDVKTNESLVVTGSDMSIAPIGCGENFCNMTHAVTWRVGRDRSDHAGDKRKLSPSLSSAVLPAAKRVKV